MIDYKGENTISKFRKYFIPDTAYFSFWYPKTGYANRKHQHREITDAEINLHFEGKQGLQISPFVDETRVKFGVIDVDKKDFSIVKLLVERLLKLNIYPNIFHSKSKGYHIYILPEKPIEAKTIRYNLKKVITDDIAIENTTDKNGNPLEKIVVELFPKQEKITEKGGNKVNLPLFGDQRKQVNFNREILNTFNMFITPNEKFETPIKTKENLHHPQETQKNIEPKQESTKTTTISNTYPCIEKALQGVSEGIRDEWGLELVRYMTYNKYPDIIIDTIMHNWNQKNNPPLPEKQLEKIIRQGKKYAGKNVPDCEEPFVKMFCDRKHCRKAEVTLCDDPLLIKKYDGYYMKDKNEHIYKATNFIMDIISADKGIKNLVIKIIQGENEGTVVIEKENPSWGEFIMNSGFQKVVCHHKKGVELSFLIAAELANTDVKIEETNITEMELDKIIAMINEDIIRHRIPEYEENIELFPEEIPSGWYKDGIVYLKAGDFCQRHRIKTKELASILKDNEILQIKVRPPVQGQNPIRVWEIFLNSKEDKKDLF